MNDFDKFHDFIKEMRENERKMVKTQLQTGKQCINESIEKLDNIDKIIEHTVTFLIDLKQHNHDKGTIG